MADSKPKKEEQEVKADEAKKSKETDSAKPNQNNQRRGQKRKFNDDNEPFVVVEDEPEIADDVFCLDWFNSDLNMKINKEDFVSGESFHRDGWGYVWAGARTTFGFASGKVCFEVKLLENLEVKLENEKNLHEFRLGFSSDDSTLQLGENETSFAFCSSGKKANDCKFEEFGSSFSKDDVITAFLDFETEPGKVKIGFAKNGEDLGDAFDFDASELNGQALFPHVSSRNVKFEANFGKTVKDGSEVAPWKEVEGRGGYVQVGLADNALRVRGMPRIEKRENCEMILLIGLPAAGKTTWAAKQVQENPDKRYYVIGTNALIEKMKVDGEPKKKHFEGKWDNLIQKCTRCLQDWLRLASQRRRNFIIDQTNVYPNAQKRKIRPFEGMTRKAVVIVPSDEEFKKRADAQESKDVPDNAVMEMKANMILPADGSETPFKEIIFPDLQREEATKLIEQYNKDAKAKGFGKKNENKRMRGNFRMQNRGGRMNARGIRGGPMGRFPQNFRGGPLMRGRPHGHMRGGPGMMRGPMRGGPMGGPMRGGNLFGGPRNMNMQQRHMNQGKNRNQGNQNRKSGGNAGPNQGGNRMRGGGGNMGSRGGGMGMGGGMMGGGNKFGGNRFSGNAAWGGGNRGGNEGPWSNNQWPQQNQGGMNRNANWGGPWNNQGGQGGMRQGAGGGPPSPWNNNMNRNQGMMNPMMRQGPGGNNWPGNQGGSGNFNNMTGGGGYPGNQNWGSGYNPQY